MEKSTQPITTSSAAVEVIAKDSIGEAEEIIENIDIEAVEKQPSIDDEISKTQKTIGDIRKALVRNPDDCDCFCCDHNARANQYLHQFLRDMMGYEAEKYRQLRRYFSRQEKN